MKKKKITIYLIIFFPIVSWIILSLIFGKTNKKFDELALGNENLLVTNKINDQDFLCSSLDDVKKCIEFLKSKDFKKKILWIGNSQLYSVNQGTSYSKIAPYLVSEYFYNKQIGVIAFVAPNISFQEYSQVINYLLSNIGLDYIILPLVFDDTRENSIRNNLTDKKEDLSLKKISLQEISEQKITNFLDKNINWTQIRYQSQGYIYEVLYRFRNHLFNINPTTVRKSIKSIYEKNIKSLNETLKKVKDNKIESILYVAPIRNDVKIPYDLQEYSKFKNKMEILAKDFSFSFYNLENIVPENFWGTKTGTKLGIVDEIDFMHFKNEGHSILANEMIKILENVIK
jgi:hypothetical protein